MTVVDVNTGKFTGAGGNLEETVTKNNLEAAEEIVRQLRLRDIGGIIVVDFIDMVLESNRDLVMRRLLECLGRDRTKHQVAEVTSLGLVQMTRKRVGQGLLEVFSETCETCGGRGIVLSDEPVERRANGSDAGGRGRSSSGGGGGSGHTHAAATAAVVAAAGTATVPTRRRARGGERRQRQRRQQRRLAAAAGAAAAVAATAAASRPWPKAPDPLPSALIMQFASICTSRKYMIAAECMISERGDARGDGGEVAVWT